MKHDYLKILNENNVNNFYHFTSIANLDSILKNGIMNRKDMDNKRIKYFYTDFKRNDEQLDCVSLSLMTTNKGMLHSKKNKINSEWIVIELDAKSIIDSYYDKIYYCKYNASSKNVISLLSSNKNYLKSIEAFKNMFYKEGFPNYQAELLVNSNISIDYIEKIYVENFENKLLVEQMLKNNLIETIKVVIRRELF